MKLTRLADIEVDALSNFQIAPSTLITATGVIGAASYLNQGNLGLIVYVNNTLRGSVGSIKLSLQTTDPPNFNADGTTNASSGIWQTWGAESTAITTAGMYMLICYPGTLDAAIGGNGEAVVIQRPLPPIWRLSVTTFTAGAGNAITATITGSYLSPR